MAKSEKFPKPDPADNKLAREMLHQRRLDSVEKSITRGVVNRRQIAAALGVSVMTVQELIDEVQEEWRISSGEDLDLNRWLRVQQINRLLMEAVNSFDKSKEDLEEFSTTEKSCSVCGGAGKDLKQVTETTECTVCGGQGIEEYQPGKYKRCESCNGSGSHSEGPDCLECQGRGKVILEITKTRGSAGNPAFLMAAKGLVETAAKLEGLFPADARIQGRLLDAADAIGGEFAEKVHLLYQQAQPDVLITALAALDKLKRSVDDQQVIEVVNTKDQK